jgi:outer membrane protein OmpA-like peptidoglycan-associated protein
VIDTKNGDRIENVGTAGAEYAEKPHFSKEAALQDIQKQLEGLENTEVTIDDKGITLRLENIRFRADSAVLLDSEKEKMEKISEILKNYSANDLLISGYTARAGTEESCIALSKERAAAVADFLVNLGVKDARHIFTQGFGSSFPIADNSTEEGMARNRRVEITIMN